MAKGKMKEALREKSFGAFVVGGDIDADETKTTVQLSGLSELNRWTVLSGASAEGQ